VGRGGKLYYGDLLKLLLNGKSLKTLKALEITSRFGGEGREVSDKDMPGRVSIP